MTAPARSGSLVRTAGVVVGAELGGAGLAGELLRALVQPEPVLCEVQRQLAPVDADRLLQLARAHRVSGRVAAGVGTARLALPDAVAAELAADRTATSAAHLTAVRGLAGVDAALAAAGIPFLVVKGPVLSSFWYGDAGARRYGDLDLLVDPGDFAAALDALGAAGFEELVTNWAGHARLGVAETPLQRGPIALDLHWDLVGLGVDRTDVDLRTAELLRRARTVVVGGREIATLDAEDTLLHLGVHGGLAGGRRLLHLLDVDVVVRAGPDWDVIVARAGQAGCRALALGLLQRARRVLGTPVPDEVLDRLEPYPGLRAVTTRLDRLHDNGVTGGGVQLESLRDRPGATVRAATRRLRVAGRTALTGEHPAAEGTELAWQAGAIDGAQVRADRAAYLSWVAAEAAMVTARPTRDAARLARLFADHEPFSSLPLADACSAARLGGTHRAWVVRSRDGELLGALVTSLRGLSLSLAFPFLLDPAAAAPIARLVDGSSAMTIVGRQADVEPLEPLVQRWRDTNDATWAAVLENQLPRPLPGTATRVATAADVEELAAVARRIVPSAFALDVLARMWARRAVGLGCTVLVEDGAIVGYCAVDGATDRVEVLGAIGLVPERRGQGLAPELTLGAAGAARRRGRGLLTVTLPRLESRIAELAPSVEPALIARLHRPRRFPGEPRIWRALQRLASGRRRSS